MYNWYFSPHVKRLQQVIHVIQQEVHFKFFLHTVGVNAVAMDAD